jgi:hypothetical protein
MKIQIVLGVISLPIFGWSQTEQKLRARELFFTPPPAAQQKKPATAVQKQSSAHKKTQVAKERPPSAGNQSTAPAKASPVAEPDIPIVNASAVPLGVRYSILKRQGGQFGEVDPESTFRSGDAIRVSVEANDTGFLYIVMQGTSGNWRLLFPSPEIDSGNNRVVRNRRYEIPSRNAFVFDEQAGTEKLFLVLTRRPESDLEKLIYSLSSGRETAGQKEMMLANSRPAISDDLVNRLRGRVLARDLVFEKVDETTPGERKETAVYVVNHSRAPDSRLVVDLQLAHR